MRNSDADIIAKTNNFPGPKRAELLEFLRLSSKSVENDQAMEDAIHASIAMRHVTLGTKSN